MNRRDLPLWGTGPIAFVDGGGGFNRSVQHGRVFCVVRIGGTDLANLGRAGLPEARKRELWDRWKAGESISDIARALEKPPGSIHGVPKTTDGIAPSRRLRIVLPSQVGILPLDRGSAPGREGNLVRLTDSEAGLAPVLTHKASPGCIRVSEKPLEAATRPPILSSSDAPSSGLLPHPAP